VSSSLTPENKRLLVKLEYCNSSFSIKDRTALGLVKAAMRSGKLVPEGQFWFRS
jgi:cysteine synthase